MNVFEYFKALEGWGYEISISATSEDNIYRLTGEALDFRTGQVESFSVTVWDGGQYFNPRIYGLPKVPAVEWHGHRNGVSGFPFKVAKKGTAVYVRFAHQVGAHVFHPVDAQFLTDDNFVIDVEGGQVVYWKDGDSRMVGFLETGGVRDSKFAAFNLDILLDDDVRFMYNSYRGDRLLGELIQKGIIHE